MQQTFSFSLTQADYFEFNKVYINATPAVKRRNETIRFLVPLMYMGLALIFGPDLGLVQTYIVYGFLGLVSIGWIVYFPRINNGRIINKLNRLQRSGKINYNRQITYKFGDEGFAEGDADSEAIIKYSQIERVIKGGTAIYLFTEAKSAHLIPHRVFANKREYDAFVKFISSKIT